VAADPGGAALDMPAGPSEVMIIADGSASAAWVAADLLAQAEHDPLSQAILLTDQLELRDAVAAELRTQMRSLSRSQILERSIAAARLIRVPDIQTACAIAEDYAPEHLILETLQAESLLPRISTAGSVFLGHFSPESMGDYCSGTNHVLPTYGYARAYSGLSVHDFQRRMTVQSLTRAGLQSLGPTAISLAELEGLDAHARAVSIRLQAPEASL
jgi:histidinol dehydrogenase